MTELEIIQHLGLSVNEAKVYLAFFGKGNFSATEIANSSGVSRTIIYRVLDSLMDKGLCSLIPGKIKKYRVAEPEIGFNELIRTKEKNIEEAYGLMETLKERFVQNASDDSNLDYIEILKDPVLINSRYIEYLARTEYEVLGFVRKPTVSVKAHTIEQQANEAIKLNREKGVVHKSIFELGLILDENPSSENIQTCLEFAEKVKAEGNRQIRIHKKLPIKATIFDERYVMLVLPDPVTKEFAITTLIFDHKQLALALKMLFGFIWDQAMEWDEFVANHILK